MHQTKKKINKLYAENKKKKSNKKNKKRKNMKK